MKPGLYIDRYVISYSFIFMIIHKLRFKKKMIFNLKARSPLTFYISNMKNQYLFISNEIEIYMICLEFVYFAETKIFLLKVQKIK